ncbi:CHAD domain-containing protein [Solitalea koreensis]|uniref:CHAD domain-containing protein n=1 Tax=Solitalea koreensis TaxID=543615 RepID=A0A521DDV7_9SPHI|nr:CHAD domain-containing protein [Solitalea koreensis]SMO69869.1 CHAD domain-containing protein [Solitalea koreensis]
MNKAEIVLINDKFFKIFFKYARKIERNLKVGNIDFLWRELKRYSAFLRMLSYETNADLLMPKTIKAIYGKAGIIRDLQLHIQRVYEAAKNNTHKPYKYMLLLENELDEWEDKMLDALSLNPWPDAQEFIKEKFPDSVHLTAIERFVRKKIIEIASLITAYQDDNDENLHLIRKKLKDILHNIKTFEEELKQPFPIMIWNKDEIKPVESLIVELEQFNDLCISISLLRLAQESEINADEKKQLKIISHQLSNEKEKVKVCILTHLTNLNVNPCRYM